MLPVAGGSKCGSMQATNEASGRRGEKSGEEKWLAESQPVKKSRTFSCSGRRDDDDCAGSRADRRRRLVSGGGSGCGFMPALY